MGLIKDDLAERAEEVRETHLSWVFLHDKQVFKLKKPINLLFADFSTLEKRKQACEAELRLNRRLAPEVYVSVQPVTRNGAGAHSIAGAGQVVDYVVVMQRMPDATRADKLVADGKLQVAQVDLMAERLVSFHERAATGVEIAHFGDLEVVRKNVEENFEQTRETVQKYLSRDQIDEVKDKQLTFLKDHARLFAQRVDEGRVRDCHGDLKLEHFYLLQGGVEVLDCIEFNDRFRYGDTSADLAFLSMDLKGHGRVDLAERLLARYALASNDYALYRLIDFYESYRAYTRAKIATMLEADPGVPHGEREEARRVARRYFMLALASGHGAVVAPRVVAVAGGIACGKSTIADRLSFALGGARVSSDHIRKYQNNAAAFEPLHEPAFQGSYDELATERVYTELLERAGQVLESGRPVVLDASFGKRRHRDAARRLAVEALVPFQLVHCQASTETCQQRLAARARAASVSDGRSEILEDFLQRFEAITELPEEQYCLIDTARGIEDNMQLLEQWLPAWPEGLTT